MNAQTLPVQGLETPEPLLRYDARNLMQGAPQIEIQLGDQVYRLRITKAGKLILTK